jgi:hypothetical protein
VNIDKSKTHLNRREKADSCFAPSIQRKESKVTKKYFLYLLTSEELRTRGFSDRKAKLVINAYQVFVLSNE